MAIVNEILVGRYNRGLQKLLSMKGSASVIQIAGEIIPSFSLFYGRENRYLEAWQLFGARIQQAASAGNNSAARFANFVGSNVIAVIESIKVALSVAGQLELEITNPSAFITNLANVVTAAGFDARNNPPGTGTGGAQCVLSSNNNVGQGPRVIFDDVQLPTVGATSNDLIVHEDQEITLLPGNDIQIRTLTLNVVLTVSIRWRERFLEESERT